MRKTTVKYHIQFTAMIVVIKKMEEKELVFDNLGNNLSSTTFRCEKIDECSYYT